MILEALVKYYERRNENDPSNIAPEGFEYKEIPFILVLDKQGNIVNIENTYEGEGKSKRAKKVLLSKGIKKTSGIASNLLWENPEYALGIPSKSKNEKVIKMHEAFKERINSLGEVEDNSLKALKLFLKNENKSVMLQAKAQNDNNFEKNYKQLLNKNLPMTFKLQGETYTVSESEAVKSAIRVQLKLVRSDKKTGICLISGKENRIEKLHHAIKGVRGSQSSGANIVSFQRSSGYDSYGKEQGYNAPCCEKAVFAYTTALNSLLGKDSEQKMQIGDATTVFWAEKENKFEKNLSNFFNSPPKDDPDRGTRAVRDLSKSIENGAYAVEDGDREFYVLGLSPNAGRISIRFFIKNKISEMAENIKQYFSDIEIVKPSYEKAFLPVFYLLKSTAVQGKADNIAPHLAGDFMTAVLNKLPYPITLLQAAINRIKAEEGKITYPRAALIKSYLNRLARKNKKEELEVELNKKNEGQGYVLGRLFSTLEKLQQEALGETNSTIVRYYGSASSTPVAVFPTLMRLSRHHLDKLGKEKGGRAVYFDKLLSEIINKINNEKGYPSHLALLEQGMFSIGYYQQRQDFFTKADRADEDEENEKATINSSEDGKRK